MEISRTLPLCPFSYKRVAVCLIILLLSNENKIFWFLFRSSERWQLLSNSLERHNPLFLESLVAFSQLTVGLTAQGNDLHLCILSAAIHERFLPSSPVSVKGRNFLTLKDFTTEEIQQFLWTAADLKHRYTADKEVRAVPSQTS